MPELDGLAEGDHRFLTQYRFEVACCAFFVGQWRGNAPLAAVITLVLVSTKQILFFYWKCTTLHNLIDTVGLIVS